MKFCKQEKKKVQQRINRRRKAQKENYYKQKTVIYPDSEPDEGSLR